MLHDCSVFFMSPGDKTKYYQYEINHVISGNDQNSLLNYPTGTTAYPNDICHP
jgi:hypothetical protein